ncbi:MAG: hypothetical protein NPIRA01_09720 [Nitrospirales bacterium]|nr:MAG: hypothetical protein NPIRA01_09720 [Nitrospirales bacterium]
MTAFYIRTSILIALLFFPATGFAESLVIGLSPYQEKEAATAQVKSTLQFLTDVLKPGDSALVFDAWHIRTLGMFTVPNKSAYRHPKAKLQANRQVVKALLTFAKQAREPQGNNEPSVSGALRLPQALRFIGENYPAIQESDLILLGSPIYDDPKEKDFSMTGNHIPGDGHLIHARSDTPYGIKGQDTLLNKRRVHIGFADERWKRDDHHGYFVKRFWDVFIQRQGGALSTFTSDLPTLLGRVKAKSPAPTQTYEMQDTDKLEMILLRPPVVRDELSIYERPLTTTPLALDILRQAPNVEIGLTWECGECDLDLYARNGASSEPLSYLNKHTPAGHFWKDWIRSPLGNAYETVTYHTPVDVEQLFLAANFYGGHAPDGVKGELRISLNGQTYAKRFHLQAIKGNGGEKREETLEAGIPASAHWLVFNPLAVIGGFVEAPVLSRR